MARRIIVRSNKGGVGKTAWVVLVAEALARLGYTTDVIDLAPQGNATRRLGVDQAKLAADNHPTIADLLHPDAALRATYAETLTPCGWDEPWADRIRVVPQVDADSLQLRAEEAAKPGAGTRLRRGIGRGDDDRHITLIDCDPGLDHLSINGLAAADDVVLIVEPQYDAVQGAINVLNNVLAVRDAIERPDLTVSGVALSKVRSQGERSATQRAQIANLPSAFARLERGPEIIWSDAPVPFFDTLDRSQNDGIPLSRLTHPSARVLEAVVRAHAVRVLAMDGYDVPHLTDKPHVTDNRKVPA